jgi:hypothetical protein
MTERSDGGPPAAALLEFGVPSLAFRVQSVSEACTSLRRPMFVSVAAVGIAFFFLTIPLVANRLPAFSAG